MLCVGCRLRCMGLYLCLCVGNDQVEGVWFRCMCEVVCCISMFRFMCSVVGYVYVYGLCRCTC